MNYDETTRAAMDAARGASDRARVWREELGDVYWGVGMLVGPGRVAILATDPDNPAGGWGIYEGTPDREADGEGWTDIPDEWGTDPAKIGARFAAMYRETTTPAGLWRIATGPQIAAARSLCNPLWVGGASVDGSGVLYVRTLNRWNAAPGQWFAIDPGGDIRNVRGPMDTPSGDPLRVVGAGPFLNHPAAMMADYASIPGAYVAHTGGGCMAIIVTRDNWSPAGFEIIAANDGELPGDTIGAGHVMDGVAFSFGVDPASDSDAADKWSCAYNGVNVWPDESAPGGWPRPARVAEIFTTFGDTLALLAADNPPADYDAADDLVSRAIAETVAAFPGEVSAY